jgi:16S rRNA G966 N2-methylase RsmD
VRSIGRQKLGYFPLSSIEADRIRRFLLFSGEERSVLDPCAGTGAALARITSDARASRFAVELDAYRAEEAAKAVDQVIHGNCFDVHCPVESYSLLFLNPPYDHEISENRNARMERLFLEHTYRWLKPAGVVVLVIPGSRLNECADVLAVHFRDKAIYRLSEPEAVRYNQIVLFGMRRTRREREPSISKNTSAADAGGSSESARGPSVSSGVSTSYDGADLPRDAIWRRAWSRSFANVASFRRGT